MPKPKPDENEKDFLARCIPIVIDDGTAEGQEQAAAICYSIWREAKSAPSVKAVGDWELLVRAVPFGKDRDEQTFDANTNYMLTAFASPVITYHHGIEPGKQGIQPAPVVVGKTIGAPEVKTDGVWIRVLLDKAVEFARRLWDAAKNGKVVASSDSLAHLARLEVNGKARMYDKNTPGRISVWPLAGVSLWDAVAGNFTPASPNAIAMPVMKAIYHGAGLDFPEIGTGGEPEATKMAGRARAAQERAKKILQKTK